MSVSWLYSQMHLKLFLKSKGLKYMSSLQHHSQKMTKEALMFCNHRSGPCFSPKILFVHIFCLEWDQNVHKSAKPSLFCYLSPSPVEGIAFKKTHTHNMTKFSDKTNRNFLILLQGLNFTDYFETYLIIDKIHSSTIMTINCNGIRNKVKNLFLGVSVLMSNIIMNK